MRKLLFILLLVALYVAHLTGQQPAEEARKLTSLGLGNDGSIALKSIHATPFGKLLGTASFPGTESTAHFVLIDPQSGEKTPLEEVGVRAEEIPRSRTDFRNILLNAGDATFILRNRLPDSRLYMVDSRERLITVDSGSKWYFGVVAFDGKLYAAAGNSVTDMIEVIELDPTGGEGTVVASAPAPELSLDRGQILKGAGKLLVIPVDVNLFGSAYLFDPTTPALARINDGGEALQLQLNEAAHRNIRAANNPVAFHDGYFYLAGYPPLASAQKLFRISAASGTVSSAEILPPEGSTARINDIDLLSDGDRLFIHASDGFSADEALLATVDDNLTLSPLGTAADRRRQAGSPVIFDGKPLFAVVTDDGYTLLQYTDGQLRTFYGSDPGSRVDLVHLFPVENRLLVAEGGSSYRNLGIRSFSSTGGSSWRRIFDGQEEELRSPGVFTVIGGAFYLLTDTDEALLSYFGDNLNLRTVTSVEVAARLKVPRLISVTPSSNTAVVEFEDQGYALGFDGRVRRLVTSSGADVFRRVWNVGGEVYLSPLFVGEPLTKFDGSRIVNIPEVVLPDGSRTSSSDTRFWEVIDEDSFLGFASREIENAVGSFGVIYTEENGELHVDPTPGAVAPWAFSIANEQDPTLVAGKTELTDGAVSGYRVFTTSDETWLDIETTQRYSYLIADATHVYLLALDDEFNGQSIDIYDRATGTLGRSVAFTTERNFVSRRLSNGQLYLAYIREGEGLELYALPAEGEELVLLTNGMPGEASGLLSPFGGRLGTDIVYQATTPETGVELFRSDGTPEGTELLADILPGTESSQPNYYAQHADGLFFAATGEQGREVYRALPDGRVMLVADVMPGSVGSSPRDLRLIGDVLYFMARSPESGQYEVYELPMSLTVSTDEVAVGVPPGVFPNPIGQTPARIQAASGELIDRLEVFNSIGQRVLSRTVGGAAATELSLPDLPAGKYWLRTRYASGAVALSGLVKAR